MLPLSLTRQIVICRDGKSAQRSLSIRAIREIRGQSNSQSNSMETSSPATWRGGTEIHLSPVLVLL